MYSIDVLVDGKPCHKYHHDGKIYIEGRKNTQYQVRLQNHSARDAEFVVSIDGLAITDGKTAGKQSTGYIVRGYQTSIIDGWLVDQNTAAAFAFSAKSKGYAEGKGKGENSGVIGLMVFPRKVYYQPAFEPFVSNPLSTWSGGYVGNLSSGQMMHNNVSSSITGSNVSSSLGSSRSRSDGRSRTKSIPDVQTNNFFQASLGTEFGEAVEFSTRQESFERESEFPSMTSAIYYGDARDLNAMGIQLEWQRNAAYKRVDPHPFPGDYCDIPPNWTPHPKVRGTRRR